MLSPWKAQGEPRRLRRALSDEERAALTRRRDELAPWLRGYEGHERDWVALALADMFSSFRSIRVVEENAVAMIDGASRALWGFPVWAIEQACRFIQTNGVWRSGKLDRTWPPNDSEIVVEVRGRIRLYETQYMSAAALLAMEVEDAR